jgi:hypothetical protein
MLFTHVKKDSSPKDLKNKVTFQIYQLIGVVVRNKGENRFPRIEE